MLVNLSENIAQSLAYRIWYILARHLVSRVKQWADTEINPRIWRRETPELLESGLRHWSRARPSKGWGRQNTASQQHTWELQTVPCSWTKSCVRTSSQWKDVSTRVRRWYSRGQKWNTGGVPFDTVCRVSGDKTGYTPPRQTLQCVNRENVLHGGGMSESAIN